MQQQNIKERVILGLIGFYAYIILLGIIIISLLILFIWRINKVGDIIASARFIL